MTELTRVDRGLEGVAIAYDFEPSFQAIATALAGISQTSGATTTSTVSANSATVEMSQSLSQIVQLLSIMAANSTAIVSNLVNINANLSNINGNISSLVSLSTSTGIRTQSPDSYTPILDLYDWYIAQENELEVIESFTSTEFLNFVQSVNSVTNAMPRFR
jgi:hypothetical protein